MQVNRTIWIPGNRWPEFWQAVKSHALSHRVVAVPDGEGFHVSYVPGGKIDQLMADGFREDVSPAHHVR